MTCTPLSLSHSTPDQWIIIGNAHNVTDPVTAIIKNSLGLIPRHNLLVVASNTDVREDNSQKTSNYRSTN